MSRRPAAGGAGTSGADAEGPALTVGLPHSAAPPLTAGGRRAPLPAFTPPPCGGASHWLRGLLPTNGRPGGGASREAGGAGRGRRHFVRRGEGSGPLASSQQLPSQRRGAQAGRAGPSWAEPGRAGPSRGGSPHGRQVAAGRGAAPLGREV